MKKLFLFMLTALLSVATWAADDISNKVLVAVGNVQYGQTTAPALRVTMDGTDIPDAYWEFKGYYRKNDGTGSAVALNTLQVDEKGYARIDFKGVYSGTAYGEFTVSKAKVEVAIKDDAYFTKVYKSSTKPTIAKTNLTITVREVDVTSDIDDYLNVDASKLNNYSWDGEDAASYPITFQGISLKDTKNYELVIAERKMTITPKTITTGTEFKFTRSDYDATKKFTYNAAEQQRPTYKVEWDHDGNASTPAIVLKEGKDFKLKFNGNVNTVDADTYDVTITGINNYDGTDVDIDAFDFEILKAPLTVMALPQTKVYDGSAFSLETAKFNVSGRVGGDATESVTGLEADATLYVNVGKYPIDVKYSSAKIGNKSMSTNYDVTVVKMDWEITKRDVTLTVPDAEITKGDALPAPTAIAAKDVELKAGDGETGALNATDQAAIADCYKAVIANGTGEPLEGVDASTVEIKDYVEGIKAQQTTTPSENYNVIIKRGTLKVKGAGFTIMPVVESDIEYGNDYTIGYYANGATIDESKLVFVINGKDEFPYAAKITGLPTEISNYTVTIKEGTAVGVEANANGVPTLQSTSYSIIKRKITVNVKDQTVHSEDPETILNELTEGTKGYTLGAGQSLVEGDVLNLTYSFDGNVVKIAGGKIKGYQDGKSNADNAIKVSAGANSKNPHYKITIGTSGKLNIINEHVADLAAATAEKTIKDAAANGSEYTVTISGRKLNAKAWNVLVLPFEVKTFDFCQAIGGYAVFNVLKSAKDGNVKFGLELDRIPANTPFMVKPLAAVDFDAKTEVLPATTPKTYTRDIEFTKVKFVNAKPTVTVDDATLTGTYTAGLAIEEPSFYAMQGGEWKQFSTAMTLGFTRAYLTVDGAANVRFFVEEPNGDGTTSIKELNADTMQSVETEGLYNLNGVRVQKAQKGIYIKNGKKVVVK